MNKIKVMSAKPENAVCFKLILSDHIVIMDLCVKGKSLSLNQDSSACYNSKSSLFVFCTKYKKKPSLAITLMVPFSVFKGIVQLFEVGLYGGFQ